MSVGVMLSLGSMALTVPLLAVLVIWSALLVLMLPFRIKKPVPVGFRRLMGLILTLVGICFASIALVVFWPVVRIIWNMIGIFSWFMTFIIRSVNFLFRIMSSKIFARTAAVAVLIAWAIWFFDLVPVLASHYERMSFKTEAPTVQQIDEWAGLTLVFFPLLVIVIGLPVYIVFLAVINDLNRREEDRLDLAITAAWMQQFDKGTRPVNPKEFRRAIVQIAGWACSNRRNRRILRNLDQAVHEVWDDWVFRGANEMTLEHFQHMVKKTLEYAAPRRRPFEPSGTA